MEVRLVGFNVPLKFLKELSAEPSPEHIKHAHSKFTPETISAAFARASRSQKDMIGLVEEAYDDTESARRSVTSILGIGHTSIADHALFNYTIMSVSRLLVEAIEERRLAGYTEKSQRYVTLAGDYLKPKEFSKEDLAEFEKLVELQNDFYFKTNEKLFEYLKRKNPGKTDKNSLKLLEGSAKEDARYSLSLATLAQLGCSYPGQTVELAIRKNKYGELIEQKEFARQLYEETVKHSPSLIQSSDPELFKQFHDGKELNDNNFKFTRKTLKELAERTFKKAEKYIHAYKLAQPPVEFIEDFPAKLARCNDADINIISAILHQNSNRKIEECYAVASILTKENEAEDFMKEALKHLSEFDKLPREFEISNGLIFEIILSSSAFAQLKRHRLMTLLSQDYDPKLGYTIPPGIREIGAERELTNICDKSSELYHKFRGKYGKAAEYCLTNAHRRRVIVSANIREIYHISRLREDKHAQWDIRNIAHSISELSKQYAPLSTKLLGGKDIFRDARKNFYEK